jgi:hypothetical protein
VTTAAQHFGNGRPADAASSVPTGTASVGTLLAAPAQAELPLTIVVVSYNRRDLLARCLDSLLHDPDGPDHEVIVVDNASHDGTPTMVA